MMRRQTRFFLTVLGAILLLISSSSTSSGVQALSSSSDELLGDALAANGDISSSTSQDEALDQNHLRGLGTCVTSNYAGQFGSYSLCKQQIISSGMTFAGQLCTLNGWKMLRQFYNPQCSSTGLGTFTYKCC